MTKNNSYKAYFVNLWNSSIELIVFVRILMYSTSYLSGMKWFLEWIVEDVFVALIKILFQLVFSIGESCILVFIWDEKRKEAYRQKSKDSAMPYIVGFTILIGACCLLF